MLVWFSPIWALSPDILTFFPHAIGYILYTFLSCTSQDWYHRAKREYENNVPNWNVNATSKKTKAIWVFSAFLTTLVNTLWGNWFLMSSYSTSELILVCNVSHLMKLTRCDKTFLKLKYMHSRTYEYDPVVRWQEIVIARIIFLLRSIALSCACEIANLLKIGSNSKHAAIFISLKQLCV